MIRRTVAAWLLFVVCAALICADEGISAEIAIATDSGEAISSVLPEGWRSFTEAELRKIINGVGASEGSELLAGYVDQDEYGSRALIFVFQTRSDAEVPLQHRQKMLSWFRRNQEIFAKMLPAAASNMTLEDLEYDVDRQIIFFEAKMNVSGQELYGKTSIIFLKKGYLNIVGYETNGNKKLPPVFDDFVKKISLPSSMRSVQVVSLPALIRQYWQQFSGITIILAVYGVVFARREKGSG